MAKASPALTSFVSGELSPTLEGRIDLAIYASGCYKLENFIPMTQGPARRRSGTRFVKEVKNSTDRPWSMKFVFNAGDSYFLEWGDHYVRFYTNHGAVLEDPYTITAATAANPVVITADAGTDFMDGDEIFISGVAGMTQLNGRYFTISVVAANMFSLNGIDGTGYTAYTSGGTASRVYEITSPYGVDDLVDADGFFALSYVQSADVIYIAHAHFTPYKLSRLGATNWTLLPFEIKGGPFKPVNSDDNLTVTASDGDWEEGVTVTMTATSPIFEAGHVGALFYFEQNSVRKIRPWEAEKDFISIDDGRRYNGVVYRCDNIAAGGTPAPTPGYGRTGDTPPTHLKGSAWDSGETAAGCRWKYINAGFGWVQIFSVVSSTVITAIVKKNLPAHVALGTGETTSKWAFGAWSDVEGWPDKVTFFKERLVFAKRGQIWASVAGDFEVFTASDEGGLVTTDMAISITIPTQEQSEWLQELDQLIVGTSGTEVALGPTNLAQPIGPDNIQTRPAMTHGSRNVRPARVKDSILFVQLSGRKLREFHGNSDSYVANYQADDLTTRAEHITRGGIISQAYQQEPDSVLWCVLGQEDE